MVCPTQFLKKRRERRFIPSRNFWSVGINVLTLQTESNTINSNIHSQNGEKEERKKEAAERKRMAKIDKEVKRLLKGNWPLERIAEVQGVDMETVKASADRIAKENPFDIVVLDDDYGEVLERLRAQGFQSVDTGLGESHRLRYPRGPFESPPPEVAPSSLGNVVAIIEY